MELNKCEWCGQMVTEGTQHKPNGACEDCDVALKEAGPEVSATKCAVRKDEYDASNLRFYARLFEEHKWQDPVIHWGVFHQTLNEIAARIENSRAELAAANEYLRRISLTGVWGAGGVGSGSPSSMGIGQDAFDQAQRMEAEIVRLRIQLTPFIDGVVDDRDRWMRDARQLVVELALANERIAKLEKKHG